MYWSGSEKLQIVYFYFRIHFLCQSFSVVVRICFTLSNPRIKSAAFSAIMIVGAFVFPDGILRMTEASATRRFFTPLTLVKMIKYTYNKLTDYSFVKYGFFSLSYNFSIAEFSCKTDNASIYSNFMYWGFGSTLSTLSMLDSLHAINHDCSYSVHNCQHR